MILDLDLFASGLQLRPLKSFPGWSVFACNIPLRVGRSAVHSLKGDEAMSGSDLLLTCSDCGQEFVFTAGEQQFFQERGYSSPRRCKPCRQAKQGAGGGGGGGGPPPAPSAARGRRLQQGGGRRPRQGQGNTRGLCQLWQNHNGAFR